LGIIALNVQVASPAPARCAQIYGTLLSHAGTSAGAARPGNVLEGDLLCWEQ